MSGTIKVSTPSIDALQVALDKKVNQCLAASGQVVATEVKGRWKTGKGADNTTLQDPKISYDYRVKKEESGRLGVIDLNYTGQLSQSFMTRKVTQTEAVIGFGAEQLPKARKNAELRPQMLQTDDSLAKVASDAFNRILRKLVKFK